MTALRLKFPLGMGWGALCGDRVPPAAATDLCDFYPLVTNQAFQGLAGISVSTPSWKLLFLETQLLLILQSALQIDPLCLSLQ